jgi:3-dehydroquinate synthase
VEVVALDLGQDSYSIVVGVDLISDIDLISPHIKARSVLVVTNETVAPILLDTLLNTLSAYQVDTVILPDGEQFKNLDTLNMIFDALLSENHNRSTTLIALGGGVVGDMTGFAAASYQRGVPFIQIPTTLLSQVDSSVGGKTAVNHALGKNMIGAFYQPQVVIIDINSLKSLTKRDFASGMAEVIKHGALADIQYFEWLEDNLTDILSLNTAALTTAIRWSCEIKAKVVSQDEKESGVRALLNFGHTFGHAIENGLGYGQWTHGEAVAAGMVMAADLSQRLNLCSMEDALRLKRLLQRSGLPVSPPQEMSGKFMDLMLRDKKVTDSGLRFVLLDALGDARLVDNVEEGVLLLTLEAKDGLFSVD